MNITILNADMIAEKRVPQITAYVNGLLRGEFNLEHNEIKQIGIRQKGLIVANIQIVNQENNYSISLIEEGTHVL